MTATLTQVINHVNGPEIKLFPARFVLMRAADELPAIQHAWTEFEDLVGLRGRKFYGLVDERAGEYLVATATRADDPPDHWGLETGELPGGEYLRTVLTGTPPALYQRIGPTMQHLQTLSPVDTTRYLVEFYRRHDEIELWLPTSGDQRAESCMGWAARASPSAVRR